eukprot:TRINITY_DN4241_c0_g1_i5.p1 TRINITY_DN4241_c0_g1~~TRINITY_DN4241_c0_g1_i5.p1  ORF type:complete len:236 (-),score=63.09 TRINITY_DN4241_c0_g1_i5:260-967(-)
MTEEMLNGFLQDYNSGRISVPQSQGGWGGKGASMGSYGGWGGKGDWGGKGGNVGGYGSYGGKGGPSGPSGQDNLSTIIKLGQRFSPAWKMAWCTYCSTYGEGVFDPSRQSYEFCQNFLELMGTGGLEIMNSDPAAQANMKHGLEAGWDQPSAKRQRTGGSGYNGQMMQPSISSSQHAPGSEGDQLAQTIKQIQKSDPIKKQMWSDFCDQNGDGKGTKDPSRLPLATLQAFMQIAA